MPTNPQLDNQQNTHKESEDQKSNDAILNEAIGNSNQSRTQNDNDIEKVDIKFNQQEQETVKTLEFMLGLSLKDTINSCISYTRWLHQQNEKDTNSIKEKIMQEREARHDKQNTKTVPIPILTKNKADGISYSIEESVYVGLHLLKQKLVLEQKPEMNDFKESPSS